MTRLKLWAIARHDLRLSEEEWENLWVDEFAALFDRHLQVTRGEDARLAISIAQLLQIHTQQTVKPQSLFEQFRKTREH